MPRKLTAHARATVHWGTSQAGGMRYHQTEVVRWDALTITLDTGGWKSATTKTRMNQASDWYGLKFSVYTRARQWYVRYDGTEYPIHGQVLTLARREPTSIQESAPC